jgi:hypothetical protein
MVIKGKKDAKRRRVLCWHLGVLEIDNEHEHDNENLERLGDSSKHCA